MVFHNKKEFKEFIISKKLYKIDGGAEGEFYISTMDRKGYKIFFNFEKYCMPIYEIDKVIMNDEVNIDSFIFPEELLIVNDQIKGYVTKYVSKNMLLDNNLISIDIDNFDFKSFKEAYINMKIDIVLLSEKHIAVYDILNNLIYNGKKLYAIDTLGYYKSDSKYLLKRNIASLDSAIDMIFEMLFLPSYPTIKARGKMNVIEYIDYLEKHISKCYKKYILNY